MISFIKAYRQTWLAWSRWPVFRIVLWLLVAQAIITLVNLNMRPNHLPGRFEAKGPARSWLEQMWTDSAVQDVVRIFGTAVPLFLVVIVPILIIQHVKEQMRDWRAALVPNFRRSHLHVSAQIFALFVIAALAIPAFEELYTALDFFSPSYSHPTLVQYIATFFYYENDEMLRVVLPIVSMLAGSLFVMAITAWAAVWLTQWYAVGAVLILGVIVFVFRLTWLSETLEGMREEPAQFGSLLGADLFMFVALWMRLAAVTGEGEPVPIDERLAWLSGVLAGGRAQRPGGLVGAGTFRRAQFRRRIGLGRRFVCVATLFMAATFLIVPFVGYLAVELQPILFASDALACAAVMSALAIGLSWPQRFAELSEVELLRPARREDCAREVGLAMLWDAAEISVAMLLAMCVPIAYWSGEVLWTGAFWVTMAAVMLSEILVFGAVAWTMLLRSRGVKLSVLAASILILIQMMDYATDKQSLMPSVIAAVIGVVLAAHAYRRWMRADLM